MKPSWIWLAALTLYGVFTLWYVNWSGPLSNEEIDAYEARLMEGAEAFSPERLALMRAFLEADDGGEFFMLNLIRFPDEPVADPGTGERRPAADVLREYTGRFMPAVFRRAGHPAFFGPAVGGYVEHWGVEPDPGWSLAGVIRYRSRRDLMELVVDPAFAPAHVFKQAAISNTLAFPVAPAVTFLGPRAWVGMLLALAAALVHLAFGRRGGAESSRPAEEA